MRQVLHSPLGHSMETDDLKLQRLKHIAGKHGYDIIRAPLDDHEPRRGWRVVKTFHEGPKPHIVFGGHVDGPGATLDEVAAYLDML
jgi:hypothetical protein